MTDTPERIRPRQRVAHRVGELADQMGLALYGDPTIEVDSISIDSRSSVPGDLFAALPGVKTHGAMYAAKAVSRGARAILTDPTGLDLALVQDVPVLVADDPRLIVGELAALMYGYPATAMSTFAVTGTNGKTTTTYFLAEILQLLGARTGLIGTVEIRSGDRVVPSSLTTPEAVDVHAIIAAMRDEKISALAMEVSSHALALHRVDGLTFNVVGFTNLSQDHLDFHGTIDEYFATKANLFTPIRAQRGVVCVDDSWGVAMATKASIPVTTLSCDPERQADWTVSSRLDNVGNSTVTMRHTHGDEVTWMMSMPGTYNVMNAALAVAMVLDHGVHSDVMNRVLASGLHPTVPGRMEQVDSHDGQTPRVIVDFAHNPEALTLVLSAVRLTTVGRLIVVFGATGERDRAKRPAMGKIAVQNADIVVITDDDPHAEDPSVIRAEVIAGAFQEQERRSQLGQCCEVHEIAPRLTAIRWAITTAQQRDTVVLAGRGHETVQEVAGVDLPLDDRLEAQAALAQWKMNQAGRTSTSFERQEL